MTIQQVAHLLHVKEQTIYNRRAAGTFPRGCKVGRRVLYPRNEITTFIESHREQAHADARERGVEHVTR